MEERLDRVLHVRIFTLDAGLHDRRVSQDEDGRRADEPEEGAHGGRDPQEREADDEEAGVEGLLRDDVLADLHRLGCWCACMSDDGGRKRKEGTYRIC